MILNQQFKTTQLKSRADHFWAYGVNIVKPNHQKVDEIKAEGHLPECFGSKVWQANFLLMDMLSKAPLRPSLNVLEIGAGWGALSVFLSKHFDADVIASDLDHNVKPYQQMLAERNKAPVKSKVMCIEDIDEQMLSRVDLIIASDICYDHHTQIALESLVERVACRSDVVMLLADIGRKAFLTLTQNSENLIDVELNQHSILQPISLDGFVLSVNKVKELLC